MGLDPTCYPVKKVYLLVDRYDAEVVIDEYCRDDEDGDEDVGGGGGGARGMEHLRQVVPFVLVLFQFQICFVSISIGF